MKEVIDRYRNIILAILATITLMASAYAGVCTVIDSRAETIADEKDAPLYKELQFLNCMFRVTLTPEQQTEAEQLYKSVTDIGHK